MPERTVGSGTLGLTERSRHYVVITNADSRVAEECDSLESAWSLCEYLATAIQARPMVLSYIYPTRSQS